MITIAILDKKIFENNQFDSILDRELLKIVNSDTPVYIPHFVRNGILFKLSYQECYDFLIENNFQSFKIFNYEFYHAILFCFIDKEDNVLFKLKFL